MNLFTCNRLWLCISALLALIADVAPASAADATERTIRILTYNVQFLPGPASAKNERPNPSYRASRIAEEAGRFDIVALQETFHDTYRGQLLQELKARWKGVLNSVASPTPADFYTSGGCVILTRMPIISNGSIVYANFSKPADYGLRADGYAAKGVIHARIVHDKNSPDDFVDVFATHMEARDDDLRPLQYGELAMFVQATSSLEHPAIILGDMNTRGSKPYRDDTDSQYSDLIRNLRQARPNGELIDVWPYLRGDALGGTTEQESSEIGKRIDYIFVINPAKPGAQLKPVSVAVRLFQAPKVFALSDHNGVVAELKWVIAE